MVSFFGDFIIASFENKFVKNFVDLSTEDDTKYTCFIYEKCVLQYTINDTCYADNVYIYPDIKKVIIEIDGYTYIHSFSSAIF